MKYLEWHVLCLPKIGFVCFLQLQPKIRITMINDIKTIKINNLSMV